MRQRAAEMHAKGAYYVNSNDQRDAAPFFAEERVLLQAAAKYDAQAAAALGGGTPPSAGVSGPDRTSQQIANAQNAIGSAMGMLSMMQQQQAAQNQATEAAQQEREMEQQATAQRRQIEDQQKLASAKQQYGDLYSWGELAQAAFAPISRPVSYDDVSLNVNQSSGRTTQNVASVIGQTGQNIGSVLRATAARDAVSSIIFGEEPPTPVVIATAVGEVTVTPANVQEVLMTATDWVRFCEAVTSPHEPGNYAWGLSLIHDTPKWVPKEWSEKTDGLLLNGTKQAAPVILQLIEDVLGPLPKTKKSPSGGTGIRG